MALLSHPKLGIAATCHALDVARATYHRRANPMHGPKPKRPSPARRISDVERQEILNILTEPRFADYSPAEVHATVLDEGSHPCSVRTMHRVLVEHTCVRERRNQLRHPVYKAPELLATLPNQLWSWDITKLYGPSKWTYYYMYVILDVFSRNIVGWMIAHRESSTLAQKLIDETCRRQRIGRDQLTLHADRGSSMTSKPVAFLLADLGVTKTHSRPYVSNDNPYSEAHFKTLKYRPDFPQRFGCLQDARDFAADFFAWYNNEHHHSGLAMMTPSDVHHGRVELRILQRQATLDAAFALHPERFPHGRPQAQRPPLEVWINKPHPAPGAMLEGGPCEGLVRDARSVTGANPEPTH